MKIRILLRALLLHVGVAALLLAGCHSAPQPEPIRENTNPDTAGIADETRSVADAALGKQAEILAHGDLARNGTEQELVINRVANERKIGDRTQDSAVILITRAVVLEKSNGQWREILRCDEHLKNQNGYLGGSTAARITGWRLEFKTDTKQGLELMFTPAGSEAGEEGTGMGEPGGRTVVVRWSAKAKRYQSLDSAHEGFLTEAPMLETPQSILK